MAHASDKAAVIEAAAWLPCRQPILEVEVSVLERVLRSNVIGNFLTTKHFAPAPRFLSGCH